MYLGLEAKSRFKSRHSRRVLPARKLACLSRMTNCGRIRSASLPTIGVGRAAVLHFCQQCVDALCLQSASAVASSASPRAVTDVHSG